MAKVFDSIPANRRAQFLEELLDWYVEAQGLGAMPKQDFDALLIHLFLKHSQNSYDPFHLSTTFKVKENRAKSLRLQGEVKFGDADPLKPWLHITELLRDAKFDVSSLESGDIRFKLSDPADFRYFQNRARKFGPCSYSSAAEAVIVSLRTFFDLLNDVYDDLEAERPEGYEDALANIRHVLNNMKETLQINAVSDLDSKKQKVKDAINYGSQLGSIGGILGNIIANL